MTSRTFLVRWYGTAAAVASLLAIQAILMPRWPSARPLPATAIRDALGQAGLASTTSPTGPTWGATRSYELATSVPVIVPLRDGLVVTVMAAAVRQRFNLQTAFIGRDQPSLHLKKRQRQGLPAPTAIGLAEGRSSLQTCHVAGLPAAESFGVTRDQITALADRQFTGWPTGLKRLLGLSPIRDYSCTLISLRSPDGQRPPVATWQEVLQAIGPALPSPLP
jgi:hypothetical protein